MIVRNLDGRRLSLTTVDGGQASLRVPFTSCGAAAGWRFTSTGAAMGVRLAETVGVAEPESFAVAGGVLWIESGRTGRRVYRGFWEGQNWGLLVTGVGAKVDELAALVGLIGPQENDEGLEIRPPPGRSWEQVPSIRKIVTTVGLIEAHHVNSPDAPPLPTWQGTQLGAALRVYRNDQSRGTHFVFTGGNVAGTIQPPPDQLDAVLNAADLSMTFV